MYERRYAAGRYVAATSSEGSQVNHVILRASSEVTFSITRERMVRPNPGAAALGISPLLWAASRVGRSPGVHQRRTPNPVRRRIDPTLEPVRSSFAIEPVAAQLLHKSGRRALAMTETRDFSKDF